MHFSNCKWTLAGGVSDGMCVTVSVQYDRLHVVFVVGDNLLAICIRPNGTGREAEESIQLDQIFSEIIFLKGHFIEARLKTTSDYRKSTFHYPLIVLYTALRTLKVSKCWKQFLKLSFEPKTNENIFVFLP